MRANAKSTFCRVYTIGKKARVTNRIATTSNVSLLTKELSQAIIEAELDQIHFSIYGLNDSNYRVFSKAKIDFAQIIDNIKYFYEYKSNYANNVHVHIKMNMDYFSKQDHARFLELFGNYADSIYLDGVANIWPGVDVSNSLNINLSLESNQSESKLSHQYGHTITNNAICPIVFYQLLIYSNGDISPCCADFQAKMALGNVSSTTIKQVWESALLQKK
ncbi:radical SAM/SPASM domain-containing protein [Helicobacter muridarum]|uniref:Molybdopterin cofactor synthesis protein A n=1 Tax=Helicobacter muridarum TaxID=216 RepID=A0A099TYG6_9HELI|nr:radical SAM/SPASM domain-containing protein [Helicobacter muridarum]TLD98280.1 radical SAM/SPASM domain-containing protein [Helicobacter muridarum]STQ85571.1 molybdopterin cofactor synthesis protein A [Helicobacter muridarum]